VEKLAIEEGGQAEVKVIKLFSFFVVVELS
jgi:hypothetical protein